MRNPFYISSNCPKHYFAGTQRVSSKIGTTENVGDYLYDWFTQGTGGPVDVIGSSFGVLENAEQGVVQVYDELGIDPPTYESNPVFIPVQSFVHGTNENEVYWFHPDHLGSTSYITNLLGEVSQHMEYFAFGETFVEEHRSSNNSPYKFNGKELDEETGWYYYGARYYDPRISVWLSVDPLAEKYPSYSPYIYTYNNPIVLIDPDGKEGVPVSTGRYEVPWPKLKAHQWYVINGRTDPKTFNAAALYNLKHNNTWAYTNISERNAFYAWADKKLAGTTDWFGAAEIVTRANAVGAADGINLWYLTDDAEDFLKAGNKYLFSYNAKNAKSLINNGGLSGSFTDANGLDISFDGLKGKELDYAMVKYEQTKVQDFMKQYKKDYPNASISDIMESINYSMGSRFAPVEIKSVMKNYFNTDKGQEAFDFGNYNHRVILGEKLVDILNAKRTGVKYEKIINH